MKRPRTVSVGGAAAAGGVVVGCVNVVAGRAHIAGDGRRSTIRAAGRARNGGGRGSALAVGGGVRGLLEGCGTNQI